jgi:hypothetical protein
MICFRRVQVARLILSLFFLSSTIVSALRTRHSALALRAIISKAERHEQKGSPVEQGAQCQAPTGAGRLDIEAERAQSK